MTHEKEAPGKSGEVIPDSATAPNREQPVALIHQITASFNSSANLYFIVRESDLDRAIRNNYRRHAELLLKKSVLYANRTIMLRNPATFFTGYGRETSLINDWGDGEIFCKMKEISGGLENKKLFDNIFTVLPEKISYESEFSDNDESNVESEEFNFSSSHSNRFGIDLALSDPTVNSHVFERVDADSRCISVLNIWLPQLENVPLDVLLKIRRDEEASFQRFQFAIQKLIANAKDLRSEMILKELFQTVDYEVRSFQAKMEAIRKSRALAQYQAALGFSIMGLCFAMPTDIAKAILGFVGAYQYKDFIDSLIRVRSRANDLKTSDFYVPWLCTTKSKH